MARIMMSKKNRQLYRVAKQGKDKQKDKVEALVAKRRKLEQEAQHQKQEQLKQQQGVAAGVGTLATVGTKKRKK